MQSPNGTSATSAAGLPPACPFSCSADCTSCSANLTKAYCVEMCYHDVAGPAQSGCKFELTYDQRATPVHADYHGNGY